MFKFLTSRHRKIYFNIGLKYNMWPDKVRKLAHGKSAKTNKERKVMHALLDQGVVHRRSQSSDQ